jgi:hypothetical protein
VAQARWGRAGFAVGIDGLGPQDADSELVVAEVPGRYGFDLRGVSAEQVKAVAAWTIN